MSLKGHFKIIAKKKHTQNECAESLVNL